MIAAIIARVKPLSSALRDGWGVFAFGFHPTSYFPLVILSIGRSDRNNQL